MVTKLAIHQLWSQKIYPKRALPRPLRMLERRRCRW